MTTRVDVGFVPLLDAAPLVIAAELGFAEEEDVELVLHREMSWATLRDRLMWGQYDAAPMLAPVVVASGAGVGPWRVPLEATMVLSVNGDVIGVSSRLAAAMGADRLDFLDAAATGRALVSAAPGPIRLGVPFPLSMHAELVSYWLRGLGVEGAVELATIPPPRMAAAIASGEIDAFCVGEPWGSVAVDQGVAQLILPGSAIWRFAPEKVLAVTRDSLRMAPQRAAALMRMSWRAARWLADSANTTTAAEILSRPAYLDVAADILERPLRGRLVVSSRGTERQVPGCIEFFAGAATFPWRSQGLWIADALARRTGADRERLRAAARTAFRADLYRQVLGPAGADLPGASEKLEGAIAVPTAVASTLGNLTLEPDSFFDGRVFDPSHPD